MTKVLFLGCHADDIELGCGATIHKHRYDWDIHCVTLSGSSYSPMGNQGEYPEIWREQQKSLIKLGVPIQNLTWLEFKTNYFDEARDQIYRQLRSVTEKLMPDIVYTQEKDDNLDHGVLHDESFRTCQYSTLIAYHIPRSQAVFNTNLYESVQIDNVDAKVASLSQYHMYAKKHYFREEFVRAQLVYNGCYVGHRFAEPFRIIRTVS